MVQALKKRDASQNFVNRSCVNLQRMNKTLKDAMEVRGRIEARDRDDKDDEEYSELIRVKFVDNTKALTADIEAMQLKLRELRANYKESGAKIERSCMYLEEMTAKEDAATSARAQSLQLQTETKEREANSLKHEEAKRKELEAARQALERMQRDNEGYEQQQQS